MWKTLKLTSILEKVEEEDSKLEVFTCFPKVLNSLWDAIMYLVRFNLAT
jgi:hypothetical protein